MGHLEVVKLLLEKGLNVNAKADNGMTALMAALFAGHPQVVDMLIKKGLDPDAQSVEVKKEDQWGADPARNLEVVKLIVEKGADVNAKTNDGSTVLKMAERFGRSDLVQYLKAQGAK